METRRVLRQVGAIGTAAGTVVAGTVVDAAPVDARFERGASQDSAEGWASLDSQSAPAGAEPLCYLAGAWTGPKRVSSGAIRGSARYICALPFGFYWIWEAVLQRKAGSTWQGYSAAEGEVCAPFGEFDICDVTDGGPYRSGTYRIRATLGYAASGGTAYVYSPEVRIP